MLFHHARNKCLCENVLRVVCYGKRYNIFITSKSWYDDITIFTLVRSNSISSAYECTHTACHSSIKLTKCKFYIYIRLNCSPQRIRKAIPSLWLSMFLLYCSAHAYSSRSEREGVCSDTRTQCPDCERELENGSGGEQRNQQKEKGMERRSGKRR